MTPKPERERPQTADRPGLGSNVSASGSPGPSADVPGGSVARNFFMLALPEPVNRAARFLAVVVLARALTLRDYSILNLGIAAAGLGVTFTTLGLPEIGARDVAVDHDRASWLAGRIVPARVGALSLAIALALAGAFLLARSDVEVIALAGLMALCAAASAEWILRGREQMRQLGLATATGGLTVLIGSALVYAFARSAEAALLVFALGEGVATALCWRSAKQIVIHPGVAGLRSLLRRSAPVALSTIAFQAYYANLDTLIIASTRSTDQAGLYSAAYRVFLTFNVVAIFAATAFLPVLARAREENDAPLADAILASGFRPLTSYGIVIVGLMDLASRPLLSLLFGARFAGMDHVLVVLSVGLMWYVVGYPAGYAFVASNQSRRFLAGAVAAALIDVSLDLILIPGDGPVGAAAAMAVALGVASLIWLQLHGLLTGAARFYVLALAASSTGAVVAQLAPSLATAVGIITLAGGAAVGATSAAAAVRVGLAAAQRRRASGRRASG